MCATLLHWEHGQPLYGHALTIISLDCKTESYLLAIDMYRKISGPNVAVFHAVLTHKDDLLLQTQQFYNTFPGILFQANETWMLDNCTLATCEGNNKITLVLPPPADNITCASGLQPEKILHEDGCTYHYECKCK